MAAHEPILALIRKERRDDGVAYVGRLLELVLQDIWPSHLRLEMLDPARDDGVTLRERISFTVRIFRQQLSEDTRWLLFNHVGIARTQLAIPRSVRKPFVVFLHGTEAWGGSLSKMHKRVLQMARLRIAVSHCTARRLRELVPETKPISVCPLGLLPKKVSGDRQPDIDILDRVRETSAVIVGRLSAADRYKGHDQLLECWSSVCTRVPGAQLVVVGRGDDLARLTKKAVALGLERDVFFTGFVSQSTLEAILSRVRAFVMPSTGEGFGLAYLEAMRAGLPCVGSTADAASELIADGRTGFLVPPHDLDAIERVLVRLLAEPDTARKLGLEGRARYRREFTYEAFRARLGPILRQAFEDL